MRVACWCSSSSNSTFSLHCAQAPVGEVAGVAEEAVLVLDREARVRQVSRRIVVSTSDGSKVSTSTARNRIGASGSRPSTIGAVRAHDVLGREPEPLEDGQRHRRRNGRSRA